MKHTDYERIAAAIKYIAAQVERQPSLDEVAEQIHLSPYHFQRLFSRWAGVTPKRYLQALTVERAKQLLQESTSLLEVSHRIGLSGGSRLHDHFVQIEAMTPGEYKQQGEGLVIEYGVQASPFGEALIAMTPRGICKLAFLETETTAQVLRQIKQTWPQARLQASPKKAGALLNQIFQQQGKPDRPLSLHVTGTNFQIQVWRALLRIPAGSVTSYSQLAQAIGKPRAARTVGSAVAANPVAFLIPCHRVIQQSGQIGQYHWGATRKHALHVWEAARYDK